SDGPHYAPLTLGIEKDRLSDEDFTPGNEDAALDQDVELKTEQTNVYIIDCHGYLDDKVAIHRAKNKRPRASKDDRSTQRNPKKRQESKMLNKAESVRTVAIAETSVNVENTTTVETQVTSENVEKQSMSETVETSGTVETAVAKAETDETQFTSDIAQTSETVETEATFDIVNSPLMLGTGATGEAHASSMQVHVSDMVAVESDHTMASSEGDND
ncbi:hypothetical protein GN958_ATG15810, partial [Phytophthora infestans]